jgi:hypothetical protein
LRSGNNVAPTVALGAKTDEIPKFAPLLDHIDDTDLTDTEPTAGLSAPCRPIRAVDAHPGLPPDTTSEHRARAGQITHGLGAGCRRHSVDRS